MVLCPARRQEWFIEGTEPTTVDRTHWQVTIDTRDGRPASEGTPAAFTGSQVIWALPAEYQEWARDNDIPQPDTLGLGRLAASEDTSQESTLVAQAPTLSLTSPDPNRSYRLDAGLPASAQQLPIRVAPAPALLSQGSPITLLLDGRPLATVGGPDYTAWWPLVPGEHTFAAIAQTETGTLIASEPVTVHVEK